jgi:hypothetical protein
MSTRCQIGFYANANAGLQEFTALLYRHHDGYPCDENGLREYGMLADLLPFLRDFQKVTGLHDASYAAARCLQQLCNVSDIRQAGGDPRKNQYYNGFGICDEFLTDIQYYYAVYPNRLDVYATRFSIYPKNWVLQDSIAL